MDTTTKSAATTIVCEILRLPVDLISASIARSGPRDACRAAVVSPAFRTAADSDIVWNCFLPSNLPPLALGELSPLPSSKKALFMRLSDGPVLFADGLTIWLDKETGAMSCMLSARKLSIDWSDTPTNDRWIPITGSRIFSDAARFQCGRHLEIHGKIDNSMLSKHTVYTVYIVVGIDDTDMWSCRGCSSHKTPVTVSLGGSTSTRDVHLDSRALYSWRLRRAGISRPTSTLQGESSDPRFSSRNSIDKWMEVELGDFYSGKGDDGVVSISLVDTSPRTSGLLVLGIEIIAKGEKA